MIAWTSLYSLREISEKKSKNITTCNILRAVLLQNLFFVPKTLRGCLAAMQVVLAISKLFLFLLPVRFFGDVKHCF